MRKAIFLDRDGTINIDYGYIYRKEDFQFLPKTIEALKLFEQLGFLLVIITNQSGIARGYYSEEEYLELNRWMIEELSKEGIHIASSYYCPHHPDAKLKQYRVVCKCRKPGTALYNQACEQLEIDDSLSYVIGDKIRDVAFCRKSAAKGILLYQDEECTEGNIISIRGGLYDAALIIKSDMEKQDERMV